MKPKGILTFPAPAPAPADEIGEYIYTADQTLNNIGLYVISSAGLLTFLIFFGLFRRRCSSKLFKIAVWTAYILSGYIISYTMGQMQSIERSTKLINCISNEPELRSCDVGGKLSFEIPQDLFVIWACILLLVRGSADSMSAYSLDDNEHRRRYVWEILVQTYWLGWLIVMSIYNTLNGEYPFFMINTEIPKLEHIIIPLCVLYLVTVYKARERVRSFRLASRSALARNTKLVNDFMEYEHELSNENDIDPTQMKGYNYLVRGEHDNKLVRVAQPLYQKRLEIKDNEVITLHKIWQCNGRLLLDDDLRRRQQLKDICLSFALYKLLCRRFAGYPFQECSLEKTWRFVVDGLLSEKDDDYERAFRVIEVELDFIFDLFYTKYASIFDKGRLKFKIIEFISVVVITSWLAIFLVIYRATDHHDRINVLVTGIAMAAVVSLEVLQLGFIIFSDWTKVILLCKYVQKPSWQASKCVEKMIEFVCRVQLFRPWERKMGQYSLLKSFNYKPSRWLYNSLTKDFLDKPQNGQKKSSPIKLSAQVKKAIIFSLKTNGRKLSNGVASLRQNGKENMLSWACTLETNTHVIMVWHIATTLCELHLSKSVSRHQNKDFIAATSLSKYCAYLVVFAPGFLPDHAYVSEFILDQVVIETRRILNKCKSMEEKFHKMMSLGPEDSDDTIIKNGVALGKDLIHKIGSEEMRWKILAEFWAEMILYVAPSDNANIHAEYLAQGGELLTHLWALLSHAGILKRDPVVQDSVVVPIV